jgi:hypothetical protein
MWISEAGVELQNSIEGTALAGENEAELKRQRIAAKDFLQLAKVARETYGERASEYVYQHIEWLYYYLYRSPTKDQRKKHHFDSALLEIEPAKPEYEEREAYCILALGKPACPARVGTEAPVAGATTSSASTVLLTVDPRCLLTKYFVAYGTSTAYGNVTSASAITNDVGTQSETVRLSGLEPCTTYHYQAEAESSANEGTPSLGGDKTFKTGGCESPTVTTGSATYMGGNMHLLSGEINPNGEASTYYFEYGPTSAYGESTSPESAGSGRSPVDVTAEIEYEESFDGDGFAHPDGIHCNFFHFRLVGTNAGGTSYGADKESIRCI